MTVVMLISEPRLETGMRDLLGKEVDAYQLVGSVGNQTICSFPLQARNFSQMGTLGSRGAWAPNAKCECAFNVVKVYGGSSY